MRHPPQPLPGHGVQITGARQPRLPWNPFTAATVRASYVPVGGVISQATWCSRACALRTSSPRSPRDQRTLAGSAGSAAGRSSPLPAPVEPDVPSPPFEGRRACRRPSPSRREASRPNRRSSPAASSPPRPPRVPCSRSPRRTPRARPAISSSRSYASVPLFQPSCRAHQAPVPPSCHLRCSPRVTGCELGGMLEENHGTSRRTAEERRETSSRTSPWVMSRRGSLHRVRPGRYSPSPRSYSCHRAAPREAQQ